MEPDHFPDRAAGTPPDTAKRKNYVLRPKDDSVHAGTAVLLVNAPKGYHSPLNPADNRPVPVIFFKSTAKVLWPPNRDKPTPKGGGKKGRSIANMSAKSRKAACIAFADAPLPWVILVTLTYEKQPSDPRTGFANFLRAFKRAFNTQTQWGWIMEYQERGVVHYHLFLGSDFVACNGCIEPGRLEIVTRRGRKTSIVRGAFDDWIVAKWTAQSPDASSRFDRFQGGGIVELFNNPGAAASYVAKEAGKKHQKRLPEGVTTGNRWWYASPECKAVPEAIGVLEKWPWLHSWNTIYDKRKLDGCIDQKRRLSDAEATDLDRVWHP